MSKKPRTWLAAIKELYPLVVEDTSSYRAGELIHGLYRKLLLRGCEYVDDQQEGFRDTMEIHRRVLEIYNLFEKDPKQIRNMDVWGTWMECEDLRFNSHNGQFMTPRSLCELLSRLTSPKDLAEDAPYRQEPYTVSDPACGTGRTLLSFVKAWRERWDRQNFILHGADIDHTMTTITTLNCIYHGCNALVFHADSLSMQVWSGWVITQMPEMSISRWEYLDTPKLDLLKEDGRLDQLFGLGKSQNM